MKKGKKIMSVILAGITAAVSYCSVTASAVPDKDPNQDGYFTIADYVCIIQYLGGYFEPSDLSQLDIDDNGVVSQMDAYYIDLYEGGLWGN